MPSIDDRPGIRLATVLLPMLFICAYSQTSFSLGNFYPINQMGMFDTPLYSESRLVVVNEAGVESDVWSFDQWSCPVGTHFSARMDARCVFERYSSTDDLANDWLHDHPGPATAGDPVHVIRRGFVVDPVTNAIHSRDCPIVVCHAHRRAHTWNL
jgi:hypothetical protein